MKKLTYKGKDVKVVKIKNNNCSDDCIFTEHCEKANYKAVEKWETENELKPCDGVQYLYK